MKKNVFAYVEWLRRKKVEKKENKKKERKSDTWISLNAIFLRQDKLSGRNVVTSNKVNIRQDTRQNFFFLEHQLLIITSKVCVAL